MTLWASQHAHLREEEARDPVRGGGAVGNPVRNEAGALQQVVHPAGQGLEGWVCLGRPHLRHLRQCLRQDFVSYGSASGGLRQGLLAFLDKGA